MPIKVISTIDKARIEPRKIYFIFAGVLDPGRMSKKRQKSPNIKPERAPLSLTAVAHAAQSPISKQKKMDFNQRRLIKLR